MRIVASTTPEIQNICDSLWLIANRANDYAHSQKEYMFDHIGA